MKKNVKLSLSMSNNKIYTNPLLDYINQNEGKIFIENNNINNITEIEKAYFFFAPFY